MSLRDYSEVLDIGSIWQTRRRGSLNIVLYITNLDLSSETRKKHVPQVVFSDGQHVLSTTVDRFISRREYIRTDKDVANMLFDALAMPITREEQAPSFLLDEEDVDDETGIYVGEDDDQYNGPENFSYEDYYPQTPASISAHEQEEIEQEAESSLGQNQDFEEPQQQQEEASVSISANTTESIHEIEECPVKFYVNDNSVESVIGYTQSYIEDGTIHEIRFSDKDAVSKIINLEAESYLLTLGSTSIEFVTQELVNAYAGYDHGQIFYSVMLLESIKDYAAQSSEEDDNLVVESENPVNITGTITQTEELTEETNEDNQDEGIQSYDLFEDMPEDQLVQTENEVQTQESDQTPEETQEENQLESAKEVAEDVVESDQETNTIISNDDVDDNEADDNKLYEDEIDNVDDAVISEPNASENIENTENVAEPKLPENTDSALFVYNKQVEENNALADRLEAAISNNKEGEQEDGSTEERSA